MRSSPDSNTRAEPSWSGRWITSGEDQSAAPLLRREFTVPVGVTSGRLHVAGLGLHRTTLNGRPVTDARLESGLTAYDKSVIFSSYDVLLEPGPAVLGLELGRGFYAMTTPNVWGWERAPWRSLRRALVQLELYGPDGTVIASVVTDESWTWSSGPTRFDSYYEGETYDARHEQPGWDCPGFDASSWTPVELTDPPTGRLVQQQHEPVRVVDELPVSSWFGGGEAPLVADFGRTIAGWVEIQLDDVPPGTIIDLQYGEQLDADGHVEAVSEHVLSDRFNRDRVITAGPPLQWEPRFSYTGFRYVEITGVTDASDLQLTAQHAHNDVRSVSTFTCSDDVLTWIDAAMRLTVRNNLHHLPTDTPVYEKNGWTGDAQVAASAMLGQYDLERLFAKWLDDMADSQLPTGLIPVIIPSPGWGYEDLAPAPEWTTLYPYLLDKVVTWYGREDLAGRHLGPVLRYLDYELARIDDDGLTSGVLGDYLTPGASGTPPHDDLRVAASCYLYRALMITADLTDRLGWRDDRQRDPAPRLRAAAAGLADALNAICWDERTGCYQSSREPHYRQTSNILPLVFGITPSDRIDAVVDRLVEDVHVRGDHHDAGCLGLSELFGVLSRHGHGDLAVAIASATTEPSWGAWMRAGETTLREMWGAESRSHNHYFMGAMAHWLYESVAGVRLLGPQWSEFEVKPTARGDLEFASYHYDGPHGRLGAGWRQQDGTFELTVTVPPATRALVHLDGQDPFWVGEGEHRWSHES